MNLQELCKAHDLTTVSVMYQNRHNSFTVYPHWEFEGEDYCASGSSETLDAAISVALAEAKAMRQDQADNANEAAWQRQQESLMESGGVDDGHYRKTMREAGRGHLLGE